MTRGKGEQSGRRLRDEVRFGVLGPVTVTDGTSALSIGGPKQRTVLAVLIAGAADPVSIDLIIDAVWGDEAAPNAKRITQTYVATLRSVVGDAIVKSGAGWRLDVDRSRIDAAQFEDLYGSAREVLDTNPQRASVALREALAMWRGIPYSDVEAHGALEGEVSRLSELRVAAQAARIESDLALGRDADLVGEIEALMAEHPYSERFRAHHMLALYRAGRQKEALRSYAQMRTVLAEELGVDPTPDLQDLEQKILDQDDSLRVMATQTIKRRAILVADPGDPIEIGHLPAEQRAELLSRSSEALRSAIDRAGDGLSVTAGTTTYVIFEDALTAARTAEMVTRRLDGDGMRVAIDWGDLLLEDDRVSGPPVSRAAVMAAVSHKGQVLLSADAHQAIAASGNGRGLRFENLGSYDLHGVEGELLVYQLLVGDLPQAFPDLDVHRLPPPLPGGGDRSVPGYELREPIAPGSVGSLYRAFQPSVGREVLIEVIGRADSSHPGFIRSFEADAQRLSLLDHQNIAQAIDYWRQPDGAFIVYRFPRGGLLSGARVEDPNRLVDQVGSALVYAHSLGMVHGSVRPDRIALDEAGNASLLCFPVADVAPARSDQYADYVAPEVELGVGPRPESDLYALGVLARNHGLADHPAVKRATDPDADQRHDSVTDFLVELNPIGVESPSTRYTEARNPYKGLAAFHEKDARDFYGRTAAVEELINALEQSHLLTLVGPSGVGKSSVVRAGVIPELRSGRIDGSEGWLVTDMLPGSHPFLELQRALERVAIEFPIELTEKLADHDPLGLGAISRALPEGTELVVVVDQFEELFTLVAESERRSFLALIEAAVRDGSVRFVLTLRADFLDRPLRHSTFGKRLKDSTVMLSAPTAEELAAAVVGPASGVGVDVAPELVERIVSDVRDQTGALPLLQHALTELFAARSSDLVGLPEFDEIGGVSGSVARRAETTYRGLTEAEQSRARQVFLRLVTIVDERSPTRRRVRLAELEDLVAEATVEAFTRSRLLVLDNDSETRSPTVEVAHEALLTHWPRLAGWIDAAREDLALSRRLDEARREWMKSGRDSAYLLTGGRLAQHETWSSSTSLVLSQLQHEYLDASREHDERLKARSRRRRNWVTAGFAAAAAVAAVFAFSAAESASRADAEALASNSILASERDPELGLLLAVQAFFESPSIASTSAIHQALQRHRNLRVVPIPDGATGIGAAIDPAGEQLAIAMQNTATVQMWDIGTDQPRWESVITDDPNAMFVSLTNIWFSEDGRRIYLPLSIPPGHRVPGPGSGLYTLDAETGSVVDFIHFPCLFRATPLGGHFVTSSPLFAIDYEFATHEQDPSRLHAVNGVCDWLGGAGVLNIESGEIVFETPRYFIGTAPSLADGGRLLAVNGFFPVGGPYERNEQVPVELDDEAFVGTKVFDTHSGEVVFEAEGFSAVTLNQDGSRVLTGRNPAYLHDVQTEGRLQTYQGDFTTHEFTVDENRVVGTSADGSIRLFDTEKGAELVDLRGHTEPARWAGQSADGNVLATAGFDAARVWDIESSTRGVLEPIDLPPLEDDRFYLDGVTGNGDFLLVRRGSFRQVGTFPEFSPHRIDVLRRSDGALLWSDDVWAAELGPDGVMLVQRVLDMNASSPTGNDNAIEIGPPELIETGTGRHIRHIEGCGEYWIPVAPHEPAEDCSEDAVIEYTRFQFSADGSTLLGATSFGVTTVWDPSTGEALRQIEPQLGDLRFGLQGFRWAAVLSLDGDQIFLPPGDEEWADFTQGGEPPTYDVMDVASGSVSARFPVDQWVDYLTYNVASGLLIGAHSNLFVVDPESWEVSSLTRSRQSVITDLAVSPSGRLAATVSFDSSVVVWDLESRRLIAEFPVLGDVGEAMRGVEFLDEDTIVVVPEKGHQLLRFTLDQVTLLDVAVKRVHRGFRPEECATFDIDPCPTLAEMRERVAG